jgi:hypothetical protein
MDISAESDEDSWQVPGTPPAEDDEMNLDEDEVASAQGDEDDEMGDDDDEVQVPLRRGVGGGAAKKAKKAVTVAQHKAPRTSSNLSPRASQYLQRRPATRLRRRSDREACTRRAVWSFPS